MIASSHEHYLEWAFRDTMWDFWVYETWSPENPKMYPIEDEE